MFGRNHQRSHLAPDFSLLEVFWILIHLFTYYRSIHIFYFFFELVLVDSVFLGIYPFYLGYLICWPTTVHSIMSILLIFTKNQLLVSLISLIFSTLIFVSFLLLALGLVLFLVPSGGSLGLLIWDLLFQCRHLQL